MNVTKLLLIASCISYLPAHGMQRAASAFARMGSKYARTTQMPRMFSTSQSNGNNNRDEQNNNRKGFKFGANHFATAYMTLYGAATLAAGASLLKKDDIKHPAFKYAYVAIKG